MKQVSRLDECRVATCFFKSASQKKVSIAVVSLSQSTFPQLSTKKIVFWSKLTIVKHQ
jgi:hypothetical protein